MGVKGVHCCGCCGCCSRCDASPSSAFLLRSSFLQVNMLVIKGRMDLEETLMMWKGNSHVANWFEAAAEKKTKKVEPEGFLDKFFNDKPL